MGEAENIYISINNDVVKIIAQGIDDQQFLIELEEKLQLIQSRVIPDTYLLLLIVRNEAFTSPRSIAKLVQLLKQSHFVALAIDLEECAYPAMIEQVCDKAFQTLALPYHVFFNQQDALQWLITVKSFN